MVFYYSHWFMGLTSNLTFNLLLQVVKKVLDQVWIIVNEPNLGEQI